MIVFSSIRQLDFFTRRDVAVQLGFGIGPAPVLGGHLPLGRAVLFLVNGVAFEAVVLAHQHLRGLGIHGQDRGREGNGRQSRQQHLTQPCLEVGTHGDVSLEKRAVASHSGYFLN